ncbi:hypothetical protein HHI36_006341, partial [Cryptolaemus montrouzieri]
MNERTHSYDQHMVQTGMTGPFGAAAPTAFPAQNGEVKADAEKPSVPLLPQPTGAAAAGAGAGPPFTPPPPQPNVTTEQPQVNLVHSPVVTQNQQQTFKCESQQGATEAENQTTTVPPTSDGAENTNTGATAAADPSKNQPKRLHVSNIPFRFRDPDLRAMFG